MPKSIIFVDSRVAGYQSLIDSFSEPAEVFVLDGASDGLTQISAYLQERTDVDAIHVISHGRVGALYLGGTVLDSTNLALYGSQLASIGGALTETGDILLYGCNVAQGNVGLQFINSLAQYTGADVAASSDATGTATSGGDWVLEQAVGSVETAAISGTEIRGLLGGNTAPTFIASTGRVTTDFGGADQANGVILQADGKIVLGGFSGANFALGRYNSDGSLDVSFDSDGKVTTDFGTSSGINSVTLQDNGKILVAGTSDTNANTRFAIARYNPDGTLDASFTDDGKLTTDIDGSYTSGNSVVLQTDGKMLVAGDTVINKSYYDFALARYNSDGTLDTSFAGDGMLTTDFGSGKGESGHSVVIQADGRIVVAGDAYNGIDSDFALARYNTDGTMDTSFDGDGKVTTDFGSSEFGYSVAIQSDGKILVAGYVFDSSSTSATNFALARYNTDGTLDTSFDGDGKVTTDFGSSEFGYSVAIQSDGKILVAGIGNGGIALARYNSNGSLDTSFDGDGKVVVNLGKNGGSSGARDFCVQTNNKIVVAGYTVDINGNQRDFALARFNADGSLDTSFGSQDNTLDNLPAFTEALPYHSVTPVTLDPDVQIFDAELASTGNYNNATLTLARHISASSQDVFSAASGTLTTLTTGSYIAVDSITIGRVTTNSAGNLTLTFTANATQALVNKAMQQIAYANTSDAPPATVQIDWTFNDGNTGAQGIGGALSVTGSTTVQITAVNDAPIVSVPLVDQPLTANTAFSYTVPTGAFTDPDLETLTYSAVMADGTGMPPWVSFSASTRTFSGTPGSGDIGSIDIRVTAKDSANASVSDVVRLTVAAPDTAAPSASTFNPIDEATGIAISSNVVLTFSEAIARGVGNIVVKTVAGVTVATYDAASSTNLAVAGNTLTINPTPDLSNGTSYKVEFAAGTIKDLAGNSYAGTTSYNFTTVGAATQTITGSTGNDSLTGSAGNDSIDGGAGTDTVVYSGSRSSYALTKTSIGFTVTDRIGTAGTDSLLNVERIKFSDGAIALDVGATQSAGQTVLLLGAVLRTLVFDASKQALLGAAIDLFDQGYNLQTLSGAVMRLPIWDVLTQKSAPTNTDIATLLLFNVNRVLPDPATLIGAVAALDTETDFATQGNFLWHLAESTANQTQIGLVGLASTGLAFTI
jgi:serralysin